jgi:hypothetical protein
VKKSDKVTFKYSEKTAENGIIDCPPSEVEKVDGIDFYYRWIHEDWHHKDNFVPILQINPKRINTPKFKTNKMKCSGYALSMHNSRENSLIHFKNIESNTPNFHQVVGSYIAELKIKTGDGYFTTPSKSEFDFGHFDFYEIKEIDWVAKIFETFQIKIEYEGDT